MEDNLPLFDEREAARVISCSVCTEPEPFLEEVATAYSEAARQFSPPSTVVADSEDLRPQFQLP
jgi:hypothetical protein